MSRPVNATTIFRVMLCVDIRDPSPADIFTKKWQEVRVQVTVNLEMNAACLCKIEDMHYSNLQFYLAGLILYL